MRAFALNGSLDIYTRSGRLVLATDIDAVKVNCESAMRTLAGEMIYNFDEGMPYFDAVWTQTDIPRFEAAARVTLGKVPNVQKVVSLTTSVADGELSYVAVIQTEFGTVEIANNG